MRNLVLIFAIPVLASSLLAHADDHGMMAQALHEAAGIADARQKIAFPPEAREHLLANMRDHLAAVSDILAALSTGAYAEAADIANVRLGVGSPAAQSCKAPQQATRPSPASRPVDMEHIMTQFMPDGMRAAGMAMHQAASDFAAAAATAGKTGDARPAFAALARATRQCTLCHAAYRID